MALHIILSENYLNYEKAFELTNLQSLESNKDEVKNKIKVESVQLG